MSRHAQWDQVVRTCRRAVAEAERPPGAARGYYAVIMETPVQRIADFLIAQLGWESARAAAAASELFTRTRYPPLMRALSAIDAPLAEMAEDDGVPDGIDIAPIRALVAEVLAEVDRPTASSSSGL